MLKNLPASAGDLGSIPQLGRSAAEGKGSPLQYSGLENSVDCKVHGVTKNRTQLSDLHLHFHCGSDEIRSESAQDSACHMVHVQSTAAVTT